MRPKLNLFFLLLFSLTVSFSWAQVPSYVPTNGLIGWWPFNGNANDESGNGHDGTLINNPTLVQDRCGNQNTAYNFNCDNYIRVEHDSDFYLTSHTISIWVEEYWPFLCANFNNGNIDINSMLCKGNIWASNSIYLITGTSSGGYLPHLATWGFNNFNRPTCSFVSICWNQFTLVYDDNTDEGKVYINDSLILTRDSLSFQLINDSALYFGYGYDNLGSIGNMWALDDIGIWNRALTRSEISTLYYSCTTSVNEQSAAEKIKFYPNPASDHLTIDCGNNFSASNNYELRITNTLGQQVFSSIINQQQLSIDLSTWTCKGIYFAYLFDENGELQDVRKIIVE